ncbi:hypothetical protein A0J61_07316 [Choanephora cucurbitarum]|uniref:Uncharacterized protein n=1 Tax=Choanephora cucurbitarum TaxID=101091 RepID=A0A1C7NBA4_9FUNG|nr:hypothetical protein A0J61_07316 [Choanephora cucurbitarum]
MGLDIKQGLVGTYITHLSPKWSDHAILFATAQLGSSKLKGGLWRATPAYITNYSIETALTILHHAGIEIPFLTFILILLLFFHICHILFVFSPFNEF